jgi:hypothetical protein
MHMTVALADGALRVLRSPSSSRSSSCSAAMGPHIAQPWLGHAM